MPDTVGSYVSRRAGEDHLLLFSYPEFLDSCVNPCDDVADDEEGI